MLRKQSKSKLERLVEKFSKPYTPKELERADKASASQTREHLKKIHQSDLDVLNAIAHKEWLSSEAKQDLDFLKEFVGASERHDVETLKKLEKKVGSIAAFKATRTLYLMDDMIRRGWDSHSFEWNAKEIERWGQSVMEQRRVVMAIDELKNLLADPQWRPLVGVCHYEICQKFYIKTRIHARFCSEAHAKYAQIKRLRKEKKLKK